MKYSNILLKYINDIYISYNALAMKNKEKAGVCADTP